MTGRFDVVAFDGDDTLWHHERLFSDISGRLRNLLEHHVDAETLDRTLLTIEQENLRLFGYGVKGFGLSLIETAVEVSAGKVTGTEIATMLEWIKEMLDDPIELLDGVESTIDALTGVVKLGVITKGDLFDQEGKIARSGLADRFDHVAIVSDKNPSTYSRVFSDWDVDPSRVLMVGNSVRSDVEPAIAAGATAVHVPYHLTWEHEVVSDPSSHFDVIEGLSEILELI